MTTLIKEVKMTPQKGVAIVAQRLKVGEEKENLLDHKFETLIAPDLDAKHRLRDCATPWGQT